MPDIPNREEIERELGGELPNDISIELFEEWPKAEKDVALFAVIRGKWAIYKKTKVGKLVSVYVILLGTGCPVPTPWDLGVRAYDASEPLIEVAYSHLFNHNDSDDQYLWVESSSTLPDMPLSSSSILSGEMPISLSAYALSASDFHV